MAASKAVVAACRNRVKCGLHNQYGSGRRRPAKINLVVARKRKKCRLVCRGLSGARRKPRGMLRAAAAKMVIVAARVSGRAGGGRRLPKAARAINSWRNSLPRKWLPNRYNIVGICDKRRRHRSGIIASWRPPSCSRVVTAPGGVARPARIFENEVKR